MKLTSFSPILVATIASAVMASLANPQATLRSPLPDRFEGLEEKAPPSTSLAGTEQEAAGELLRGLLPALIHPDPHYVCLVGAGAGRAAYTASVLGTIDRLDCFETDATLLNHLSSAAELPADPVARELLLVPHLLFRLEDPLEALRREPAAYDIVQAAPWTIASANPDHGGAEFFSLCKRRLARGGFLTAWLPSPRARAALRGLFRHGLELADPPFAIASDDPIPFDASSLVGQFDRVTVRNHLHRAAIDSDGLRERVRRLRVTVWGGTNQLARTDARL